MREEWLDRPRVRRGWRREMRSSSVRDPGLWFYVYKIWGIFKIIGLGINVYTAFPRDLRQVSLEKRLSQLNLHLKVSK